MAVMARKKAYGYTKMEKEDAEDRIHRKAQFLIYKMMQQADSISSPTKSSCYFLRFRITKLKVKIGRRLRRFRNRLLSTVSSAAKASFFHPHLVMGPHFKSVRRFFVPSTQPPVITSLPTPLFK